MMPGERLLPGEHEELQAGAAGFCPSSPQAPQARRRENHDAHRLSAHFRVRPTAADITTRLGAMWQMIIGFLYRKTNLENNHNYLPHCPKQKGDGAYDCIATCDPYTQNQRKEQENATQILLRLEAGYQQSQHQGLLPEGL